MLKLMIKFLKSLKDPCKLCLVKAACYQENQCPLYDDHIRAKRDFKSWFENVLAISLIVLASFGIIFVFVLIILGVIKFHELMF